MDDLERFKTNINLSAFAAQRYGYRIDKLKSSRSSVTMRHQGSDDKIVISRGKDGHWIYFSVRDDHDNGTIIDFVQKRLGVQSITRAIFDELRPWIGANRPSVAASLYAAKVEPTSKDRQAIVQAYHSMVRAEQHSYLEKDRAIPVGVLKERRFRGKVLTDRYRNVIFPHFDQQGICGYEIRNRGFKGFPKGGEKGLWVSETKKTDCRLVVTESGINALSYHALRPDPRTRYNSIGGNMNPVQPELLKAAIAKMPPGSTVVAATDPDEDGERYAEVIVEIASYLQVAVVRKEPPGEGDWNDVLRSRAPA